MQTSFRLGLMRPVSLRGSAPRPRPWRPARISQIQDGEPTNTERLVHFGIFAVGAIVTFAGWPLRDSAIGAVLIGAGSGMAGVGMAFFLMDLMGVKP